MLTNLKKQEFKLRNESTIKNAIQIKNTVNSKYLGIFADINTLINFFNTYGFNNLSLEVTNFSTNIRSLLTQITTLCSFIENEVHQYRGQGDNGDYGVQNNKILALQKAFDLEFIKLDQYKTYKSNIEANLQYKDKASKTKISTTDSFNDAIQKIEQFKLYCGKSVNFISAEQLLALTNNITTSNELISTLINKIEQLKLIDSPDIFTSRFNLLKTLEESFNRDLVVVKQEHQKYTEVNNVMLSYNNQLLVNAKNIAKDIAEKFKLIEESILRINEDISYTEETKNKVNGLFIKITKIQLTIKSKLENMTNVNEYDACLRDIQNSALTFKENFNAINDAINSNSNTVNNQLRNQLDMH